MPKRSKRSSSQLYLSNAHNWRHLLWPQPQRPRKCNGYSRRNELPYLRQFLRRLRPVCPNLLCRFLAVIFAKIKLLFIILFRRSKSIRCHLPSNPFVKSTLKFCQTKNNFFFFFGFFADFCWGGKYTCGGQSRSSHCKGYRGRCDTSITQSCALGEKGRTCTSCRAQKR